MVCLFRHTGILATQINVTTVIRLIFVCLAIESNAISRAIIRFSDDTLLATAENLEGVTSVQVDRGATPYLSILTLAAAEHIEGSTKHIHTLLGQDDTGSSRFDLECGLFRLVITIKTNFLAKFVRFHLIEKQVTLNEGSIEIDDHIAVYPTT